MAPVDTYIEADSRGEASCRKNATQQLQDALSSGLPALHRRAYRILGNTADAEDAVQNAFLSACTIEIQDRKALRTLSVT